ncbi:MULTISPECIES: Txe/YoeB family addiction module toxin [Proteus]|uniref:Toxin YoeB n=1 Tax=Proteus terrae subsp. cibarius TaxID=626774 RepID=A0A6G6SB18_9GAMM|nr:MULTISPECIES: Txe/YoeB family addiction module toxin [Proteus]MDY3696174.1 Txe/YoeB family addiction module toxin [Proteus mirabilis]QHP78107.1 Txe/YoeB family addiction module toxin [Proteus vulgaris]MBG2836594.1 Txe/YoeB family addiction module toxin [Proteus terrae subsp. cibarius]MBG2868315.1 Txe/YoeB family addiction module toxin [Proteus terrae subsp. cibarius]MBG2913949.1 Txe/YoeB family addiction module toxin [Proteus terrae subsp. cibarius]
MKLIFSEQSWSDYLYWQQIDKKIIKRINELIKDIKRTPFSGIGKPEPLKHNLAGFWSRRITDEHRLIYRITDSAIEIASCRYHY